VQHWLVQTGGSVARVEFVVDGTLRSTVAAAPYAYDWDTGSEAVGSHQLIVRGVGLDGIVSEQTVTVTVAAPTGP
jgi:hypothetical protein